MIFTMNTQLTLVVALLASTSGYLIKISENLSTENCQDVLNNLEVRNIIVDLIKSLKTKMQMVCGHAIIYLDWNNANFCVRYM